MPSVRQNNYRIDKLYRNVHVLTQSAIFLSICEVNGLIPTWVKLMALLNWHSSHVCLFDTALLMGLLMGQNIKCYDNMTQ